ncbi:MAG: hypothetical protein J6A28_04045 [Clostridia bacterium]|nr:hypothetical protein [Clostridia bacterium]
MEKYITKTNDRLKKKYPEETVRKIKKRYCIVGGSILGVGLAGFLATFGCFIYYFLNAETETALSAWLYAIPFVILFIAGAVITRVGDQLLKKDKASIILEEDEEKDER